MLRVVVVLVALLGAAGVSSCSAGAQSSVSGSPASGHATSALPASGVSGATGLSDAVPAPAAGLSVVPAVSDHPAVLGRQLVAAERAVRSPRTSASTLLAAARTAQAAYGRLGQHPHWAARVLRETPRSLRSAIAANLRARRELSAIPGPALSRVLPAWRIQAPAPGPRLLTWYRAAGKRFGVGWQYLAAVNLVETTFGKIHGLSAAGAQGPMQFMPSTWAAYGRGGDVNNPRDAIFGAARLLARDGFAAGHVVRALYAYNASLHYVRAVEAIASVLAHSPRSFAGYYRWDVYYPTTAGVLLLPQGFDHHRPTSAAAYARAHPGRVVH